MFNSKFKEECLKKFVSLENTQTTLASDLKSIHLQLSSIEDQFKNEIKRLKSGTIKPVPVENELIKKNPEFALVRYLYSFLPCRNVLDIGANIGDFSEYMLESGYSVHAFEPNPPVFARLHKRFESNPKFKAHPVAVGSTETTMTLHLATDLSGGIYDDATLFSTLAPHASPDDLRFTDKIEVPVRTLGSLHENKEIPDEISLVKIDTEGFDLEVITGMGPRTYPVVVAEFWDEKFLFGKSETSNKIPILVPEMVKRGYPWFVILYRVEGSEDVSFYLNQNHSIEKTWGNIFFFRDFDTFSRASRWCSAVLEETVLF